MRASSCPPVGRNSVTALWVDIVSISAKNWAIAKCSAFQSEVQCVASRNPVMLRYWSTSRIPQWALRGLGAFTMSHRTRSLLGVIAAPIFAHMVYWSLVMLATPLLPTAGPESVGIPPESAWVDLIILPVVASAFAGVAAVTISDSRNWAFSVSSAALLATYTFLVPLEGRRDVPGYIP